MKIKQSNWTGLSPHHDGFTTATSCSGSQPHPVLHPSCFKSLKVKEEVKGEREKAKQKGVALKKGRVYQLDASLASHSLHDCSADDSKR